MNVAFGALILLFVLTSCGTVPYAVPRQIEESPVVPPPIDRPVITPPATHVGVPEHSDILPEMTVSLRICRRDDECSKVDADCCGCSQGGQAGAIMQEYVQNWESSLGDKCKDIACPQVISDDWTCQVEPRCVENKCTLVKP